MEMMVIFMYDIIIIGAGCAGLTASIYAARAGKSALVLESESIGGQISFSPRVENYPGIKQISGSELADNLYDQAVALGIEIDFTTVRQIIPREKSFEIVTEEESLECKSVIVATGVKHRKLKIEGEDRLSGKGISHCAICDGAFFKGADVAVVGGGSAALQSAELLSSNCKKVYLIHRRNSFRGEESLLRRLSKKENVEFVLNSAICKLNGTDALSSVVVRDVNSGEETELSVNGLFVAVGQIPDNRSFADVIQLDEYGYIVAAEDCKTSMSGIFTAGDCRTKSIRQLTTAAADGAVSALGACSYIDSL